MLAFATKSLDNVVTSQRDSNESDGNMSNLIDLEIPYGSMLLLPSY